jgi:hypothetical protein
MWGFAIIALRQADPIRCVDYLHSQVSRRDVIDAYRLSSLNFVIREQQTSQAIHYDDIAAN